MSLRRDKTNALESTNDDEPASLWDVFCYDIGKAIEEGNVYEAANTTRNLLHLIDFECKKGKLSHECRSMLKEKCLKKYGYLVDDQGGINNYAGQIEKVVITPNPDSAEWQSTLNDLSDDDLIKLLPEHAIKPSENDVIAEKSVENTHANGVLDNGYEAAAINSFNFLHILTSEHQLIQCSFDENSFWDRVSGIVSNYKPLWEEEFNKANENNNKAQNAPAGDVLSNNPSTVRDYIVTNGNNVKPSPTIPSFRGKRLSTSDSCENNGNNSLTKYFKRQKPSVTDTDASRGSISVDSVSKAEVKGPLQFQTAKTMMGAVPAQFNYSNNTRKCLGTRRGVNSKFVAPIINANSEEKEKTPTKENNSAADVTDERLKNIDPKMVQIMLNEIMDQDLSLTWDNIAGLEFVKKTLKEIVVWPMLRPDIFTGLRGPPRGILLFGPPGTGKTLIGKCVASQSKSTFFSISASSLGSKWVGEGEKLVRALFAVARCYQPAVIFIDEIDSLLIQRSDTEHESSRRIKTEFLVQFDGVKTSSEERLLIIGATNRPQELDEAARRRLVKRLYIPLPEFEARKQIIKTLLESHSNQLTEKDLDIICEKTDGYSGADMTNLCKEAALGPIRSINFDEIAFISKDQVRPIILDDFIQALKQVRASVSSSDLGIYEDWNNKYGSGSI